MAPRKYHGPLQPGKRSAYVKGLRKKKTSLVSKIKKVSLSQCETKMSSQRFWDGTNAQPLLHNQTEYGMHALLNTTQGTDDPAGTNEDGRNRIGSEIIARGLLLKFMFISAQSRPNMNIMAYVYQYDATITAVPTDINFWSGPSGGAGNQNRFLDRPNGNKVKILRRFLISNRQNYSSNVPSGSERNNTCYKELYLPLKNKKIKYIENAAGASTATPQWKNYGVAIVAFDTTNTLPSDIVGYVTAQTTLYFKDP